MFQAYSNGDQCLSGKDDGREAYALITGVGAINVCAPREWLTDVARCWCLNNAHMPAQNQMLKTDNDLR